MTPQFLSGLSPMTQSFRSAPVSAPYWQTVRAALSNAFRRLARRPLRSLSPVSEEWLRQHDLDAGKRQEMG